MHVLDLNKVKLKKGSHSSLKGGMCVMEAVAYIAGEPWSDSPQCASPVIAAFLRSYNDSVDDKTRQSLKAYIPRLIGTRGSEALEERRALIAADWLVRTHTPAWFRLAGLAEQADALASLPEITSLAAVRSIKPVIEAARKDAEAAWAAVRAPAGYAAAGAAWAAAWAAAWDAAWCAAGGAAWAAAWDAAWYAAGEDAWAAAWAAAWCAAGYAAGGALQPTVKKLQETVPALIERMLEAKL